MQLVIRLLLLGPVRKWPSYLISQERVFLNPCEHFILLSGFEQKLHILSEFFGNYFRIAQRSTDKNRIYGFGWLVRWLKSNCPLVGPGDVPTVGLRIRKTPKRVILSRAWDFKTMHSTQKKNPLVGLPEDSESLSLNMNFPILTLH